MIYYFILHSHLYTNPLPASIPLLKMMEVGWGNGYVLLPPGHPFHGKDYNNIEAYAHGGLTFASLYKSWNQLKNYEDSGFDYQMDEKLAKVVKKYGSDFLKDHWCIGFDTAHYGNDLTTCSKEYVWNETKALHKLCVDNNIKSLRKAKLKKIADVKK